jgi:hypothetical protein
MKWNMVDRSFEIAIRAVPISPIVCPAPVIVWIPGIPGILPKPGTDSIPAERPPDSPRAGLEPPP